MTIGTSSSDISWTPAEGVTASGTVTVIASDGALQYTDTFSVTVQSVNDAPVISAITLTTATEDTLYSYSVSVSDSDDTVPDDMAYSLSNAPTGMAISASGQITWTPLEGVTTSGAVTLIVSDGPNSPTRDFIIGVTQVNDPPIITSSAPTEINELFFYSYPIVIADPDDANNGTDLSFTISGEPVGMLISATGIVTWTPPEGERSSGLVTVTVEDGGENSAAIDTQSFTIVVNEYNTPPEITSAASTTATEDIEYRYQLVVEDIDDQNYQADLTFSLENAPTGMTLPTGGLVEWTPLEGVTTSGEFSVVVADGGEDSAPPDSESYTIAVTQVNDAPVIDSSPLLAVLEGFLYEYQVMVTDPDDATNGTDLNFQLIAAPAGMAINETGLVTWTPPEGEISSDEIIIRVSDGGEDGAVPDEQNFIILVGDYNTAPLISSAAITNATEDTLYTYQVLIDDIDDQANGIDLTFTLSGMPEGMTMTNMGLITWTPTNGVLNSGALGLSVADDGEDDAQPALQDFTISVTAVNDAPIISSAAPVDADAGFLYSYQSVVDDPDDSNNGTNLSYNLANAPQGMSVSNAGLVTWTPGETSLANVTVILSVADGGENGAQPFNETFNITVNFDIDDDEIGNALDNCPQTANTDQADLDGDNQGNACDDDDDGDTLPDTFEEENELDPLDPDDAEADADGDGQSNLEEFLSGGNVNVDDVGPIVVAPRSLIIPATGQLTFVELGNATATDAGAGAFTATTDIGSNIFESGRYLIEWFAYDSLGNRGADIQTLEILPIISVSSGQTIGEGVDGFITLELSGASPNNLARVDYSLTGSAGITDHTLRAGTLNFVDGRATLNFTTTADGIGEDIEDVNVNFSNAFDSVLGDRATHTINITEENVAPTVQLSVSQGAKTGLIVSQNGGMVTVETDVIDANGDIGFFYNWDVSDERILPESLNDDPQLVFDPSVLALGLYTVQVEVTDLNSPSIADLIIQIVDDNAAVDTDANGIDDSVDMFDSGAQLQTAAGAVIALETEAQLTIELGETARHAGTNGSNISAADLASFGGSGGGLATNADSATPSSEIFDFTVRNLSGPGEVIRIVLPLSNALNEGAFYRKFSNNAWTDFVIDDKNFVESAPMVGTACPGASSSAFSLGLIAGDQCIRLNIEDGGSNDADGLANQVVKDPGAVFTAPVTSTGDAGGQSGGDSGGGASDLPLLGMLMLMSLAWFRKSSVLVFLVQRQTNERRIT
ncbi:MAG: hypothetical protein ACI81F_001884 [Thalassolituus oleivorans]|jgi:hypothetical protein